MGLTTEQRQQLITKAMKDKAFRVTLLRDARAAIAQELQMTIPPEVTLHVLALGAHEVCLVLPPYPADWPVGLSAEALEQRLSEGTGQREAAQQTVVRGQARLIAKAWHDPHFKQALLQDPRAVIEQEFGTPLPAEVTMRVVAEDAHNQYLVLPPTLEEMELTDEQLEQVAGGEVLGTIGVLLTAVATVVVSSVSASVVSAKASGW